MYFPKGKQSTATKLWWSKNIISLYVRRFLHGINPWSDVKVMVLWVISGKNKVGHFRHYLAGAIQC